MQSEKYDWATKLFDDLEEGMEKDGLPWIEIVHKPKRYPVRMGQIHSLYGRHRNEFKCGIFKEK